MHGTAILVGVLPKNVHDLLQSLDYFRELVPTIIKIVYVRIRISAPKISLDQDDWHQDQDVCTALIACSTLTPQQVSRYENDFGAGAALLGGASMALWLSGGELPARMSHESVFDVAHFMTQTSTELTEKSNSVWNSCSVALTTARRGGALTTPSIKSTESARVVLSTLHLPKTWFLPEVGLKDLQHQVRQRALLGQLWQAGY